MIVALEDFSSSGEELSPSCFKKLLKMEYQVLVDIVDKTILVKAETFDRLTKKKVQVMTAITSGTKIDWSIVLFNIMKEMLQKKSTGFAVQISKMIKDVDFSFNTENDGSSVTMADANNVLDLRPKTIVSELTAVKKEIGDQQVDAQKQKMTKRKMINLVGDSETTASEESIAHTPAIKKSKSTIRIKKTTSLHDLDHVPRNKYFQ